MSVTEKKEAENYYISRDNMTVESKDIARVVGRLQEECNDEGFLSFFVLDSEGGQFAIKTALDPEKDGPRISGCLMAFDNCDLTRARLEGFVKVTSRNFKLVLDDATAETVVDRNIQAACRSFFRKGWVIYTHNVYREAIVIDKENRVALRLASKVVDRPSKVNTVEKAKLDREDRVDYYKGLI